MVKSKTKTGSRKTIRCYLCGQELEVSTRTMSTTCPGCNKAIKVEDLLVKSYLPVNDLRTCGKIKITKRGRVAAKLIQSGEGIECEGAIEGDIESDGHVWLGPKASWKGKVLRCGSIDVAVGATMIGELKTPWVRKKTRQKII